MKFYQFLILFAGLFIANISFAQDTIVKRDDSKVIAKIIEVHEDEIHYKKFENQEGPTYIVETNKLTRIVYANGDQEDYSSVAKKQATTSTGWQSIDTPSSAPAYSEEIEVYNGNFYYHNRRIGTRKMKELIFNQGNPEAVRMWNLSNSNRAIGWACGFAEIPVGFISVVGSMSSFTPEWQMIFFGGGFVAFSAMQALNIAMRTVADNQRKRAIELYNESLGEGHEEGDYY